MPHPERRGFPPRWPPFTTGLIAVCVAIFLAETLVPEPGDHHPPRR